MSEALGTLALWLLILTPALAPEVWAAHRRGLARVRADTSHPDRGMSTDTDRTEHTA